MMIDIVVAPVLKSSVTLWQVTCLSTCFKILCVTDLWSPLVTGQPIPGISMHTQITYNDMHSLTSFPIRERGPIFALLHCRRSMLSADIALLLSTQCTVTLFGSFSQPSVHQIPFTKPQIITHFGNYFTYFYFLFIFFIY